MKNAKTIVLAVAVLLASFVPFAEAEVLPLDVRKPTLSLMATPTPMPTVEPTPKPSVSPTVEPVLEAKTETNWWQSFVLALIVIGLIGVIVWVLLQRRTSNNNSPSPLTNTDPETPDEPEIETPASTTRRPLRLAPDKEPTELEIVEPADTTRRPLRLAPQTPEVGAPVPTNQAPSGKLDEESLSVMMCLSEVTPPTPTQKQRGFVVSGELNVRETQPPVPPAETIALTPTPSSSNTAAVPRLKGPEAVVIAFLALGFAQAGTAFADCAPTRVTLGKEIVMGQSKPQAFEMFVNKDCKDITKIGGISGVNFTKVNHSKNSGRVTAEVMATSQTEAGPTQFSILDKGEEIVSPEHVVVTFLERGDTYVNNKLEEFKKGVRASTQKIAQEEVKKGVATLNGQISQVRQEVDTKTNQVRTEVSTTKADLEAKMREEIARVVGDALKERDENIGTVLNRITEALKKLAEKDTELAQSPSYQGLLRSKKPLNPDMAEPNNPKSSESIIRWILSGQAEQERNR